MKKNTVTIIGAGLMGSGIATCSSLGGYPTIMLDQKPELASAGMNKAKQNIDQLLENQLINQGQAGSAQVLLQAETNLESAVKDSFLIIEAVTENLSLK